RAAKAEIAIVIGIEPPPLALAIRPAHVTAAAVLDRRRGHSQRRCRSRRAALPRRLHRAVQRRHGVRQRDHLYLIFEVLRLELQSPGLDQLVVGRQGLLGHYLRRRGGGPARREQRGAAAVLNDLLLVDVDGGNRGNLLVLSLDRG